MAVDISRLVDRAIEPLSTDPKWREFFDALQSKLSYAPSQTSLFDRVSTMGQLNQEASLYNGFRGTVTAVTPSVLTFTSPEGDTFQADFVCTFDSDKYPVQFNEAWMLPDQTYVFADHATVGSPVYGGPLYPVCDYVTSIVNTKTSGIVTFIDTDVVQIALDQPFTYGEYTRGGASDPAIGKITSDSGNFTDFWQIVSAQHGMLHLGYVDDAYQISVGSHVTVTMELPQKTITRALLPLQMISKTSVPFELVSDPSLFA